MRSDHGVGGSGPASGPQGPGQNGRQDLLNLPVEPGQPEEAGAEGVRDRPQGVWAHGAGRPHQDKERDGPDHHLPPILPGRDLRLLRHEHRRLQRPGLPDEDRAVGGRRHDDHAAAAHVCDQGPGSGHDEFLQPVQEHRAVAEAEDPGGGAGWEGDKAEQEG